MFKKFIQKRLEAKVKKYLKKHKPTLVLVTGSVGKTSTKLAIATVLGEKYRVRADAGNHNTEMSVPTSIMGIEYPDRPHSVSAWRTVFRAMNLRIKEPKDADVIVQELGTDAPGDIARFGKYLMADVAVVTAVSEEHMEFFPSVTDVAKEELSVAVFSKLTVINRDDVDGQYASLVEIPNIHTYGLDERAEYRLIVEPADPLLGRIGRITTPEWPELPVSLQLIGDHSLKAAAAAACVGAKLGLTSEEIAVGVSKITPVSGRMQLLRGVNGSTIIDDTYNASPLAVSAALRLLMSLDVPKKIAVLGSMNELGATSAQAHEAIGKLCDNAYLDWVITIGEEAEKYLAPAAISKGCQVRSFLSPYEAGGFAHSLVEPGTVLLFKGSQNRIFAEEAVKEVLHSTDDEAKLVRQSEHWLDVKQSQFQKTIAED